jgi:AraC-like DNA-binding protein
MDPLSDAVAVMRSGRPHSARVRYSAPFGRQFPAVDGAGFHIVLRGHCWLFPPVGNPVPLGPGEVAFLPRGSAHGLADNPSTPLHNADESLVEAGPDPDGDNADTILACGAYMLDRAHWHPLFDELPDLMHICPRASNHAALRAAVDLLDIEMETARPGTGAMLPALLDVLLLHLLRAWFDEESTTGTAEGWIAALRDPPVTAALDALHAEPGYPWTVAELAACGGLSRATFARRFTTLAGRPPLTYLTWWRMTLAARLLRSSDMTLADVASRVGYTSEFAFAIAFKRHYGQPPGRYRRAEHDEVT